MKDNCGFLLYIPFIKIVPINFSKNELSVTPEENLIAQNTLDRYFYILRKNILYVPHRFFSFHLTYDLGALL